MFPLLRARAFSMTMKPRILLTRKLPEPAMQVFNELNANRYDLVAWEKDSPAPSKQWILDNAKGAEGAIVMMGDSIDKEFCDAAGPQLKVISTMSAGFDHVKLPVLAERSIRLGVVPDALTDAVAEITVMLVLMALRRGKEAIHVVNSGEWSNHPWSPLAFCGHGLTGATVGIIGFGRIAQASVLRLLPFGIKEVLYTTSKPNTAASSDYYNTFTGTKANNPKNIPIKPATSLDELASNSDILIVLSSYTPQTHHIVNAKFIEKMKRSAVIVNTGRGSLIDTTALATALDKGDIFAAGLDVLENEPNIEDDHPLVKNSRCALIPHIGSATTETRINMAILSIKNTFDALEGKKMVSEKKLPK